MTTPIKTVALCSATGKLGPFLLEALTKQGLSVSVITRSSSKSTFAASQKIITVPDDYPEDALVSAFQSHDAVVLSLSFELLPQAGKFAKASITAGTRWLIASTYGANLADPEYAQFPASVPHRQAVDELAELQKGQTNWAWSSISCGPWPELAIAAGAWNINPDAKTAQLVDGGRNVFSSSTRKQISIAVARILARQPASARNKLVYVASFEVNMLEWLSAYKQILGSDGWTITDVSGASLLKKSQDQLAAGQFMQGYTGTALVVCTGQGYQNRFSAFATLINQELDLPKEDLVEVVKEGLATPNPFA